MWSAIISWLLSRLFGKTPPLSQEAVQASRATKAEIELQTAKANEDYIKFAVAAVRRVDDQLVREPESIRAPDPHSRD